MKKLILREGVECVLGDNGKWTCLNKDVRGFTENYLNSVTSWIISQISPSQGDPLTVAFNETAKQVNAISTNNTDKPFTKTNPLVVS